MTPDEVLEQNVSIPLTQWVEFKAERDSLRAQNAELVALVKDHMNAFGLQALRDASDHKMADGWLRMQECASTLLAKVKQP